MLVCASCVLYGRMPVHGWLWQMMTAIDKTTKVLVETARGEAAALSKRLEALAWLDSQYNLRRGVVLPAPVPESAKVRRHRAAASAKPIPSRRPRRRLLELAVVVRRVARGRAPLSVLLPLALIAAVRTDDAQIRSRASARPSRPFRFASSRVRAAASPRLGACRGNSSSRATLR